MRPSSGHKSCLSSFFQHTTEPSALLIESPAIKGSSSPPDHTSSLGHQQQHALAVHKSLFAACCINVHLCVCMDLHREHTLQLSCFTCTGISASAYLQVPEAFPRRTQYLPPAGSSGCPSMCDMMPHGFSLCPLYPCSGRRTVFTSQGCEMGFRKRQKPCSSWRALQVSPHHITRSWRL